MGLKDTAVKFFMTEEQEDNAQAYVGPRLVKSGHLNIVVRTPKAFSDVREYADSLIEGNAIMVSFDSVDAALRNRIFDYLNGVSYIVNASVSRINEDLLLYAPEQVEVSKETVVKRGAFGFKLGK